MIRINISLFEGLVLTRPLFFFKSCFLINYLAEFADIWHEWSLHMQESASIAQNAPPPGGLAELIDRFREIWHKQSLHMQEATSLDQSFVCVLRCASGVLLTTTNRAVNIYFKGLLSYLSYHIRLLHGPFRIQHTFILNLHILGFFPHFNFSRTSPLYYTWLTRLFGIYDTH